jgi:hypothetical protein
MAIDKAEDYFLYNYKDGVKERANGRSLENLIKIVRIRSSNNQPKVQGGLDQILFLIKTDKKSVAILPMSIKLLDDNNKVVGPDQATKLQIGQSDYIPLTYDKSKKEVAELVTNKELQNKQIQEFVDYLNTSKTKGWSVIQDPWDPNTTPPENIPPTTTTTTTVNATTTGTNTTPPKVKLNIVGIPDGLTVKAKEDLSDFTIYVGDIPKEKTSNIDNFENVDELDEEYLENYAQIAEELGISPDEYKYQEDIGNGQENSDVPPTNIGQPAEIKPVSSFDSLLVLAGKCARELGKNARVNYENLKRGYTKGVHGLCPQGTQAVLYALTGIKELGMQRGNADHFSFKNPTNPPGGEGKAGFAKTGYYNDKVKVGLKDYVNNRSKWQIGDVIAVGYTEGKNYGHIQVWTGVNWMSDFKQNGIQISHVDWDSVALWRLNAKGLEAVKKQSGQISGLV